MSNNTTLKELKIKGKILRCPNCGASEADFDVDTGGLKCKKCRTVFMSPRVNELGGVEELVGEIRGDGANDIEIDDFVVTLRCPSCGANVMVNKDAETVSCHWCRHILESAERVPNGSMPDMVLPFKLKKKEALIEMKHFLRERNLFSAKGFASDLSERTIKGVYLPYAVVDINATVRLSGVGEKSVGTKLVLRNTGRDDESSLETVYEVANYDLERDFNLVIDDLTIEASSDKFEHGSPVNTSSVINAIMPFDAEEAVAWDSRYLKGFSSEKRDLNIGQLRNRVRTQVNDIARHVAMGTTSEFDRGVRWDDIKIDVQGVKWKTAYFPVWLYSCAMTGVGGKRAIHYIAVNARTGEIMGSVPLRPKIRTVIVGIPFVLTILFTVYAFMTGFSKHFWTNIACIFILITATIATAKIMKQKSREYSNVSERHMYELDTNISTKNMKTTNHYANTTIREDKRMIEGYNEEKRWGAHNLMMSEDPLEDATGIKSATYVKIVSYMIIGLFLIAIAAMLGLLVGSVIDLAG